MNIQKIMKQAQEIQNKITQVQEKFEQKEVEGKAGGGMVAVHINGKGNLKKVSIDKSLFTPDEKEVVEDLIVAAFNDAKSKADTEFNEEMNKVTGALALPPGFKMPV